MVETISLTVADARAKLGLTRAELARLLRVTTRTIIRWERSETKPHEIYLVTLTKLVEIHDKRGTSTSQVHSLPE